MNWNKALPWAIVLLCLGASVVYTCTGNTRLAIYYFLAAAITADISY